MLGRNDEICIKGVVFCLRLILGLLLRAMLGGTLACFMTACVAGVLL